MLANFQAAGVCGADRRTDYETCVVAIREARRILRDYINPCSSSDSIATLDQIIETLDREDVESALKRIDGRNHFGLVWMQSDGPLGR